MKTKKIISLVLSICIAASMFAGMKIVSSAYSITYDTQGGSAIAQTTDVETKMTGFRLRWALSYNNITTGFNWQVSSYGYVTYQFYDNYNNPNNGAQATAWNCVGVEGLVGYSGALYTYYDREANTDVSAYATNKELTDSVVKCNQSKIDGSGVGINGTLLATDGIIDIQTVNYIYVSSTVPTKEGCDFVCWKDANGNTYSPGQRLENATVTLYAQWRPHQHVYSTGYTVGKTCTEQGYISYNCACGYSYKEYFPAGHSWAISAIESNPTDSAEGVRIFTCKDCGFQKKIYFNGVESVMNVQYGNIDPVRQSLDLQIPSNAQGDCSLILAIHGGAWVAGSKDGSENTDIPDCLRYGIAKASINYRYLSATADGKCMLDDIEAALGKIKELGRERGINFTKVILMGGSAGGHLALLYAYSRADTAPIKPVAVFDQCGPADLNNPGYYASKLGSDMIAGLFSYMTGKIFNWLNRDELAPDLAKYSPISYVTPKTVPTLICHGLQDDVVPYTDSVELDEALTRCGVPHYFLSYPNSGHGLTDEKDELYRQQAQAYFEEYIGEYLLDDVPDSKHSYQATVTPATCVSEGYTTYSCTRCDTTYTDNITQKTDHNLGEWETVTSATFENEGLKVQKCTVCKQVINSEKISALEKPKYEVKEEEGVYIDSSNSLLCGIGQGENDLSKYFDMTNCVLEYKETANGFGTGTVVTVKNILGEVLQTYTVVVSGDITGDGYVDAFDVSFVNEYINNFDEPEESAFMKASDIYNDGFLDATDLAFLIAISNFE